MLQASVLATLREMGYCCVSEGSVAGISLDVCLPAHNAAVEVDGPMHFAANEEAQDMGNTRFKHRLLARTGVRAVRVRSADWPWGPKARVAMLQTWLAARGIAPPGDDDADTVAEGSGESCWVAGGYEGAGDNGVQVQQRRRSHRLQDGLAQEEEQARALATAERRDAVLHRTGKMSRAELLRKATRRGMLRKSGEVRGRADTGSPRRDGDCGQRTDGDRNPRQGSAHEGDFAE
jgi:RAP domain